jgi:DNA-binding transcriptional MerR regulator
MKSYEAANLVGIHPNTVRTWTTNEYKRFFSTGAQGGTGRTRALTKDDVRVLAYINQLKNEGRNSEEVVAALMEAERRGFQYLPFPTAPDGTLPVAMMPREAAETAIIAERKIMAEHIRWLEARVDELKDELETERNNSSTKIDELTRKLIEAQTELRLWKEGWRPPAET